jgi:hypothetical protein|tara:strand:+ start:1441 stop:1653 length:213 start_codon:yes stop_codon:yes gene_type:complete
MWFLLYITLAWGGQDNRPPHVLKSRIVKTFYSQQDCEKEVQKFLSQAKEQNIQIPIEKNFGCVKYDKIEI